MKYGDKKEARQRRIRSARIGPIAGAYLNELATIGEEGIKQKTKEATELMIARHKDQREHPEKYWITGKGGSVITRTAPSVELNDDWLKTPEGLKEDSVRWEGSWDDYRFFIEFSKSNHAVTMEVKQVPNLYENITVILPDTNVSIQTSDIQSELIGPIHPDQIKVVDSQVLNYMGTIKIRLDNPDVHGTPENIAFTMIKHSKDKKSKVTKKKDSMATITGPDWANIYGVKICSPNGFGEYTPFMPKYNELMDEKTFSKCLAYSIIEIMDEEKYKKCLEGTRPKTLLEIFSGE